MNARPIIAVDAMGGDFGPSVVVPGAIDAARLHDLHVLLVGDTPKVEAELAKLDLANVHFDIVQADDVVHMNEKPSDILRRKKNASIQVACRLVKDGKADAVVSAGHSGATVACGMFIMGRLPGVERPALAALLPTEKNPVVVLDAGANVDCRPYHLFQFGLMGDAFARDLLGYAAPRVSLLSIGEEEGKGNSQVKEAYELLKLAQNLNFVGNAEGRDIFTGDIDVVVCDGFVGNVVVKMSEGLASALVRMLKRLFTSGFLPALGGMLAKGRLLGIQFDTLFTDDLYFKIARNAIDMAFQIRDIFVSNGYPLLFDSPTNQQYPIIPDSELAILGKEFGYEYWTRVDETHSGVRFCGSWATKQENVDALRAAVNALHK